MSVRIFLTILENILELSSSETGAGGQPLVVFSFVYLFVDVLKLTGKKSKSVALRKHLKDAYEGSEGVVRHYSALSCSSLRKFWKIKY